MSTRTAVTVFTIDNDDKALWPGSYGKVVITAPVDRKVFLIPSYRAGLPGARHTGGCSLNGDRIHLQTITVSRLLDSAVDV